MPSCARPALDTAQAGEPLDWSPGTVEEAVAALLDGARMRAGKRRPPLNPKAETPRAAQIPVTSQ